MKFFQRLPSRRNQFRFANQAGQEINNNTSVTQYSTSTDQELWGKNSVDHCPPDDYPSWKVAFWYHCRTKHYPNAYAKAKDMNWDNQPNPFRKYTGATLYRLPIPDDELPVEYDDIYSLKSKHRLIPLNLTTLSDFLYHSMAISAWKALGETRWALRCNPSSGNLHPTECYIITNGVDMELPANSVFHYRPDIHKLEHRATLSYKASTILDLSGEKNGFYFALSSIHWREAWKYGERAYRYCQHDVGHALGALGLAASRLGWRLTVEPNLCAQDIDSLIGTDRQEEFHSAERETADMLVHISLDGKKAHLPFTLDVDIKKSLIDTEWYGIGNQLSKKHDSWEVIDRVHEAVNSNHTSFTNELENAACQRIPTEQVVRTCAFFQMSASNIIRNRRSAVQLNGKSGLPREKFYQILARTVPHLTPIPWDAQTWPSAIHLGLFVHLVDGIEPGIYCLIRDPKQEAALRCAMSTGDFLWQRPKDCPDELSLYCLAHIDARQIATILSCGQDIAGKGAFSLGMLAQFLPGLEQYGSAYYQRLFWESGLIGQTLYLDAEACGLQGTGIGCFFDELVHKVFCLDKSLHWQSIYHFTMGGPIKDNRLTTLPAYPSNKLG